MSPNRNDTIRGHHDRIGGVAATTPSTGIDAQTARLGEIAAAAGTPCYVYDAGAIRAAYATLDAAFDGYPHAIHYALKANSSLAIVRLLHGLGSHADANSLGEVDVALRCGYRPVSSAALDGEHCGVAAKARVNSIPSRASRSMVGVRTSSAPAAPNASARC